ncbi:MAG: LysR substrate-binding domain-containing protein [Xanthobacteraceae bacterium]
MTLDQLAIFVAVAEREHLTRAAAALGLTPSAVSASIKALEAYYNVRLFDRVGRGIELTREGRAFLREAKETLARVKSAETVLSELGRLRTGRLDVHASQTIANYWLPPRLLRFRQKHPGIEVHLTIGNTATVSAAVIEGAAELGFIEGTIDEPALALLPVMIDKLVIVTAPSRRKAGATAAAELAGLCWIMREPGSGTRAVFEQALEARAIDPRDLQVVLILPSNEAVLTAVRTSDCATALSEAVVAPFVENGQLVVLDIALPPRQFTILRHKERHLTAAAREFEAVCRAPATPQT